MTENINEDKYRAPALDKGLDILELLAQQSSGMTRSEIVKAMGRRPAEIYRMIERLVARQYVCRSPEGDRYALTMKLFLLGNAHPPLRRLTSHAQPLLDAFAQITGQSIHLAALERISAIVIAQASSPANWEFRLKVGAELDLLTTSSGNTLLAFQEDAKRKELISLIVEDSSSKLEMDEETLFKKLDSIKSDGYRVSASGQLFGVTDISVPILGNDGSAFGVITCPHIKRIDQGVVKGPVHVFDEIRELIVELSSKISIEA